MRSHEAQPVPGTARRVSDRMPADIRDPRDLPATADCMTCGQPVRLSHALADWKHVTEGDNQS
jgi:hypothetical protein